MIDDDILSDVRRKVAAAALSIAGACLTDDQIDVLSTTLAGKSAAGIKALFHAVLPPQRDRTGVLLPYLTAGKISDFAHRAHDIAVLVTGMTYHAAASASAKSATVVAREAATQAARGPEEGRSIGSAKMAEAGTTGLTGLLLKTVGLSVPPSVLWAAAGLSPGSLSVGYTGMSAVKGSLAEGGSPAGPATSRATADRDVLGAGAAAEALEKGSVP